jgi:tetratricopeptide (TPR) repeat protein
VLHSARRRMSRSRLVVVWAFLAACLLPGLSACKDEYTYYQVGNLEQNREMRTLFGLLRREGEVGENRFIIIQQIANRLLNGGQLQKLILFLTTYVENNQDDPYNAYYLSVVAATYLDMEAVPMAVHYYERILNNYPDLLVSGTTVHFQCLQQLLQLEQDPQGRIDHYKELISRFSDYIDPGLTYYLLGKAYEQVGQWDQAIRVYQKFLKYPQTEVPGVPRAFMQVSEKVALYYSDKEWMAPNLEQLVDAIKRAIWTRNTRELLRYRAKVNFFTISWSQSESEESAAVPFDIGTFLQSSRVYVDDKLDVDSNAGEAFLRTTGWSYRIPTWYLYFRKVDFKPDPEVDGRWEWAGIYYGEKL